MHDYKTADGRSYALAGMFSLALRLVTGWTYFSAFWRRLVLHNKLDPDAAGYIGEKFNHFLPNALFIRSGIEYLVSHPDVLWWFMATFTIVEGVVGLLFMLGLFTRLMSIGVAGLASPAEPPPRLSSQLDLSVTFQKVTAFIFFL